MLKMRFWTLAALLVAAAACGDSAPAGSGGNNGEANNGENNGSPNNNPGPGSELRHHSLQSVGAAANSSVRLDVQYLGGDGSKLSNETISWELVGEFENHQLDARASTTNGDGVASVNVETGNLEATFEVEASASDPDVVPIRFTVTVASKEAASYVVEVHYMGARSYTDREIKVALYKDPEDCADFNPLRPGTAERSEQRGLDAQGFPTRFTFRNLPNGDKYTAVATALAIDSDDAIVIGSFGCSDERPLIENGNDPDPIVVEMIDRLPDVTGTWQITSRFNITEALPEGVQNVLNPLLDFFSDPAGTLVALALDFLQNQFDLDVGSLENILGAIAEDLLDSVFDSIEFGNTSIRDILTAGADVGEILRNFHLQGNLVIPDETVGETGLITQAQITYFNLGYRWRLNCDEDEDYEADPTCGDAFISFDTVGLNPVEGMWDGAVTPNPDYSVNDGRVWFHELSVADHTVDLNYGAVIAYLLEKVALPLLFDPTVDSLNALLQRFIDCEALFDTNLFVTVCDTAIDEVSNLLRDQLASLSFSSDNFTLGTPATAPCALYEQTAGDYGPPEPPNRAHEPKFKEMGKDLTHPDHGDLRCEWNGTIQFSADPQDRSTFSGRWYGEKRGD